MLKIYKIAHDSKIYGPGIRDVIRFKGCSLHCKNCINPELWSTKGAKLFSIDEAVNVGWRATPTRRYSSVY